MNEDGQNTEELASLLLKVVSEARYLPERSAQHDCLNSTIRGTLQTAAYTAIEVLDHGAIEISRTDCPTIARQLLRPNDGDTERLISTAAPLLCEAGVDIMSNWFTAPASQTSLRDHVVKWCNYRNNRIGHGVVSADIREDALSWLPQLAEDLICGLAPLMPHYSHREGTVLRLDVAGRSTEIAVPTVRVIDSRPIVVREIRQRGQLWEVRGQVLDPFVSPEVTHDFDDSGLVRLIQAATNRFRQESVQMGQEIWKPMVLLPGPQTDAFEGRSAQLADLYSWLNDTESRACNLHGDGGIGKTTLVLEALNRLLTGNAPEVTWRPEIICFFSAKLTRWGPDGLVYLKGIAPPLDDAVRALAGVYEEATSREWHTTSGSRLVQRAETLLTGLGLRRDQVLLVLDNTETLARSSEDEQRLGTAMEEVTKRLARVLITSRRRERMEARPIEVLPLSTEESARLARRLADSYVATSVLQAGEVGRRKLVTSLGGHPLKIDACCRLVGRYGYSLDRAKQQVLSNSDLGKFLYEDAWARINGSQRIALVALAQLGDSLSGDLIQFVCGELHVDQSSTLDALEETKFAVRFDYATQYDVRLEASALTFLESAFQQLADEDRATVTAAVSQASRRRAELLRAQQADVHDRIGDAFGTDAARAAWQAASKGLNDDAVFWYEEAIKVEPGNGYLLDRFAFFLAAKVRNLDRAALLAEEACKLGPDNPDAFFTAGHVAASRGDPGRADRFLDKASLLGFPQHRCDLQKARARLRQIENEQEAAKVRPLGLTQRLTTTERLLRSASLALLESERDRKHQYEVGQALRRVRGIARRYDIGL